MSPQDRLDFSVEAHRIRKILVPLRGGLSYLVGKRTVESAQAFMADVRGRTLRRFPCREARKIRNPRSRAIMALLHQSMLFQSRATASLSVA